jgi:hypothetical protein
MSNKQDPKMPASDNIGYGKPPTGTRFQPGQSGNPTGRPKGSLNVATIVSRVLRERVVVVENGQRKSITKLEAAMKQIANKGAAGDFRAADRSIELAKSAEERLNQIVKTTGSLDELDSSVFKSILKKIQKTRMEKNNDDPDQS